MTGSSLLRTIRNGKHQHDRILAAMMIPSDKVVTSQQNSPMVNNSNHDVIIIKTTPPSPIDITSIWLTKHCIWFYIIISDFRRAKFTRISEKYVSPSIHTGKWTFMVRTMSTNTKVIIEMIQHHPVNVNY